MKIIIGSDKSGFSLKEAIKTYLTAKGHEVADKGTQDINNFMPYFKVAPIIARALQKGEYDKGILICGTGAGMCIVANKFKGVYAVCSEGSYSAKMSGVINKANVLTFGGWIVAPEMAFNMLDNWLNAVFAEGFPPERKAFLENAYNEVIKIEEQEFEKKNNKAKLL